MPASLPAADAAALIHPALATCPLSSTEAGSCALAIPSFGYGGFVSCKIDLLTKREVVRIRVYAREAGTCLIQGAGLWGVRQRNSTVSMQVVIT
jgi:hypothetical protein